VELDRLGMVNATLNQTAAIFANILSELEISFVFRWDKPNIWVEGVKQLNYYPVSLLPSMIDYQLACAQRFDVCDTVDISIVLTLDHKPCGFWSLSLTDANGDVSIGSKGGLLEPPVLLPSLGRRKSSEINKRCLMALRLFLEKLKQNQIVVVQEFLNSGIGISEWHDQLMRKGASVLTTYDLFLDLQPDLNKIKSGLRDSYKSLINTGYKIWEVQIMDSEAPEIWNEFRNLHKQVSGRVTRSELTWSLQYEAVVNGTAFLVYLRNEQSKIIGGALFYFSRDESVYAVGAYDRTLFDKPLGHVVQFHAISRLKTLGVRWHKLGTQTYASDFQASSNKELAITEFKRGFMSHIMPRYVIEYAPDY
jgi:FemAB family protein